MKLTIKIDIGEIEIDTDSGHGAIDAVWIDGIDVTNLTVAEMVEKIFTPEEWSRLVANAEYSKSLEN